MGREDKTGQGVALDTAKVPEIKRVGLGRNGRFWNGYAVCCAPPQGNQRRKHPAAPTDAHRAKSAHFPVPTHALSCTVWGEKNPKFATKKQSCEPNCDHLLQVRPTRLLRTRTKILLKPKAGQCISTHSQRPQSATHLYIQHRVFCALKTHNTCMKHVEGGV